MKNIVYLLAGLCLSAAVFAAPPPGGYPKQVPFMLFCHKDEALMLKAIERTFHEYIFAAGTAGDGGVLYFTRDPDDGSFSIVGTINNETCVIFNGTNLEDFDEPPYIEKEGDQDT